MKIVAVETLRADIQPNVCVVRLRTDEGIAGIGESFSNARTVEAYVHEAVAPVLLGVEDPAPERVARLLRPYLGYGSSGVETRALGAVDVAVWDLLGRATGKPLAALLGGPVRDTVPVYNTCAGYAYIKDESRQRVANWGLAAASDQRPYEDLQAFLERPAELARSLLDMGVTAMKIWPFDGAAEATGGTRIGATDLRDGLRIVEAIRREVGSAMEVLIELHGLWNLPSAVRICRALEELEPFWVEDPLRPDSVDAFRRLRDSTRVPIATGESLTGRRAFKPLLESGAIDVAIVDLNWTGGVTEARKIAALADAYDVAFAPHDCTGPIAFATSVHVVASQPNGLVQETVRAFYHDWYRELVTTLPTVADGVVRVPTGPGLGLDLAPDLAERPGVSTVVSSLP